MIPTAPSGLAAELIDEESRSFLVTWDAAAPLPAIDGWAILDDAGNLIARRSADVTEVLIADVPEAGAVVTVQAFNQYGSSDGSAVDLPPIAKDPLSELQELRNDIAEAGLTRGLTNSLTAKVDAAINALVDDRVSAACGQIGALMNELNAKNAIRNVPDGIRNEWLDTAARIQQLIGCDE